MKKPNILWANAQTAVAMNRAIELICLLEDFDVQAAWECAIVSLMAEI